MTFDWFKKKAKRNVEKHGVTFAVFIESSARLNQRRANVKKMSHEIRILDGDDPDADFEIPAEIDFSKQKVDQERTERMRAMARERAGLVQLDADLAEYFKNAVMVNAVLRRAMELSREIE